MTSTIKTREIHYNAADGTNLVGYFAAPESDAPVAGVIVAPEWWGRTEYTEQRARELAEHGYAALAIDMYGDKKVTTDAGQANEWMTQMLNDQDKLMGRCRAILDDFADQLPVDGNRLGIAGYCFGGKIGLDMAREGMPLKAVATFHGNLSPKQPAEKGKFKAKVLVAHGRDDSMVSMEDVESFKQEMDKAGVDYTVDVYDNAKHGFTNPNADKRAADNGVDLGYNEAAANESWDKMIAFMRDTL